VIISKGQGMVTIQVKKAFNLNIDSVLTHYPVGKHEVDEAVANHPYTKFHLDGDEEPAAPPAKTEAELEAEAAEIAAKTAEVIRGLVTVDKPVPNVDAINAALREAGLPTIKAADRDAVLNVTE